MSEKILSSSDLRLLESLYVSGKHTVEEIADLLECSVQFVKDHTKRKGLKVETGTPETDSRAKAVVYFAFTHGMKPRNPEKQHRHVPGYRSQSLIASHTAKIRDLTIVEYFNDYSTNKSANFFTKPGFIKAYEFAKENNCVILIHNPFRLLARLSNEDKDFHSKILMEGDVDIIDAKTNFLITGSKGGFVLNQLIQAETQLELKRHISKLSYQPSPFQKYHANKATKFAAVYSQVRRERLKPDIMNVISDLKTTGKVSLQLIADDLNRRGIKSMRGKTWSKGTITNILKKLEIDHRK